MRSLTRPPRSATDAARPRFYRLTNFFKRGRRPSRLPAAEQLSSSTAVAAEQTDEQTDRTTEDANEASELGPKRTLSSCACACVRAGRYLRRANRATDATSCVLSPRPPRSATDAARLHFYRLMNFFKRGHRPSGPEPDPTSLSPPPNPSDQVVKANPEEEEANPEEEEANPDAFVVPVNKEVELARLMNSFYALRERESEPSSVGTDKISFEVKVT